MGPLYVLPLIFLIPSVQWVLFEGHWCMTQRSTYFISASFGPSVLKLKSSSYLVPRLATLFFAGPLSRQAVCHSPKGHAIFILGYFFLQTELVPDSLLAALPTRFLSLLEEAHGINNAFLIHANIELTPLWNKLQVYSTKSIGAFHESTGMSKGRYQFSKGRWHR